MRPEINEDTKTSLQIAGLQKGGVTIDDVRIAYQEIGQGEPVVLLHGIPQDHRCWRHQIDFLSKTHRVIAPDWVGWEESEKILSNPLSYDDEITYQNKFLFALGLDKVNLVGHDHDGFIALGFAIRNPERILRLAILNSRAHQSFTPEIYWYIWLLSWLARHEVIRSFMEMLPLKQLHWLKLSQYIVKNGKGAYSSDLLEEYLSAFETSRGKSWLIHFAGNYHTEPIEEFANGLESIRFPTAVIWGDADEFLPYSTAEELKLRIPKCILSRIQGCGHFVMEERPRDVNKALFRLLKRRVYLDS